MVTRVWLVDPSDRMAGRLRLAAQHGERIVPHTATPGKDPIQNLKSSVYGLPIAFIPP